MVAAKCSLPYPWGLGKHVQRLEDVLFPVNPKRLRFAKAKQLSLGGRSAGQAGDGFAAQLKRTRGACRAQAVKRLTSVSAHALSLSLSLCLKNEYTLKKVRNKEKR